MTTCSAKHLVFQILTGRFHNQPTGCSVSTVKSYASSTLRSSYISLRGREHMYIDLNSMPTEWLSCMIMTVVSFAKDCPPIAWKIQSSIKKIIPTFFSSNNCKIKCPNRCVSHFCSPTLDSVESSSENILPKNQYERVFPMNSRFQSTYSSSLG